MKLLVATHNNHKRQEIATLLGPTWQVHCLADLPESNPPREDGETFEANARIKALACPAQPGQLVLADDSGLEVDALDGRPGVHTARFAGEGATDAQNNQALLEALCDLPPSQRLARFTCVLVLVRDGQVLTTVRGECPGHIAQELRGAHGFGYDPLFVPTGHQQTFAQLGAEIKNALSHRFQALATLQDQLRTLPLTP